MIYATYRPSKSSLKVAILDDSCDAQAFQILVSFSELEEFTKALDLFHQHMRYAREMFHETDDAKNLYEGFVDTFKRRNMPMVMLSSMPAAMDCQIHLASQIVKINVDVLGQLVKKLEEVIQEEEDYSPDNYA